MRRSKKMKKLICLVICIACVLTMLASCGDDTVCEAHADADKNGSCDTCGIPVYTVVEKVPTEEEIVDMVVSAIPEGATLGNVWAFDAEGALTEFKKADKLEDLKKAPYDPMFLDDNRTLMAYYYITQTAGADTTSENWDDESDPTGFLADDKFTDTYVVYNILEDVNVCTYTTDEYTHAERNLSNNDVARVSLEESFFIKAEIIDRSFNVYDDSDPDDGYWSSRTYYAYYLADGTKVFDERDHIDDGKWDMPTDFANDGRYAYVTIGDVKYAYDIETCALAGQGDVGTFVNRPMFIYETDAYGYVMNNGKIFVYDLSKWIECVYSYEVPTSAETWVLANGNILVQETVTLPAGAVNYDYTDGMYKYDLVYTVVDVAAKSAKEIEFGYYILNARVVDEYDDYSAAVKNVLNVQAIKDKNLGKSLALACDDALAIIAEESAVLPQFVDSVYPIAENVFFGTVVYGDGSEVDKLFDASGAELATLPNGAWARSAYVECNGKYYDFTMKLIFDPMADEDAPYFVIAERQGYLLLRNGDDYYYWNASLTAPVMIAKATNVPEASSDPDADPVVTPNPVIEQVLVDWYNLEYFIVKTTTTTASEVAGEDPTVDVEYKVYNADNKCILTTETAVEISVGSEYIVATDEKGNCYFVR